MKKLFLLAAIAVSGFVFSQETSSNGGFNQGDSFISGSVGFGTTKQGDVKSNSFNITPRYGYFVSDNIAIGAQVGFDSHKAENGSVDTADWSEFGAGLFGRYYFTPASKFSIFGHLDVDYASIDNKLSDVKTNSFGVNLAPGINYFLSDNFAIEASWGILGFNSSKVDVDGAEASTGFNFGVNLDDINFGLIYKF